MNWKEYIISDNEIAMGKPVIKGIRIPIDFIIERLASGWTEDQILDNYPKLTKEHLMIVNLSAWLSEP